MATLREMMLRLRPAGAPGAAGGTGVPADRREAVEQELEPVFAELSDAMTQRRRLLQMGAAQALTHVAEAEQRAEAMLAHATIDAAAVRAEVGATLRAKAEAEAEALVVAGRAAAGQVRQSARERLDERVKRVVRKVRENLRELSE